MSNEDWHILVRDSNRAIIGELGDEESSLEVIPRHNTAGAWKIDVPADSASAALLLEGDGIVFIDESLPAEAQVVLSGPKRPRTQQLTESDGTVGTLSVSGVDDTYAALARVVYPTWTQAITGAGVLQTDAYYTATGPAETVIRTLVDRQAGPGALTAREHPGLVLQTDLARGLTTPVKARFDRLIDVVYQLANTGGIGVEVVQSATSSNLELRFYDPADLSATARFAIGLGNLSEYSYALTPPEVTHVIVGIGGEGAARKFFEFSQADPLWPNLRIEEFLDRRDVEVAQPDAAALAQQEATQRLTEGAGKVTVTMSPIDTEQLQAARDYGRGDLVTVELDIGDVADVVTELRYSRTPDEGPRITPVVGQEQESPQIYKRVSRLIRDVQALKTRR